MTSIYIKYFANYAASGFCFEKALFSEVKASLIMLDRDPVVLDFGCGIKPYAKLFPAPKEYIGLDVYPGAEVDVVYDGGVIPFPDSHFDIIFSSSVLEHVEDLAFSLGELQRVLKPGGFFISVVPFVNHVHGAPFDFHRPTRFGWEKLLQEAGFTNPAVKAVDSRWQCVLNLMTSAINNTIYDGLKKIRALFSRNKSSSKDLHKGDASPEGGSRYLKYVYALMQLNPINFILGLLSLVLGIVPAKNLGEGEITSGYLWVGRK